MSPFSRPAAVRHGDRLVARSVFFLLLALYTATFTGLPENPDSEVEFQTVGSLVHDRSFALGRIETATGEDGSPAGEIEARTPEARVILAQRFAVHEGGPGRRGEYFSWFGVGQAIAAVPFYLAGRGLGRLFPSFEQQHRETTGVDGAAPPLIRTEYFEHLLVGWRNPLLGALTALLLVLTSVRLGASRRHAWCAGLAFGLCSFAWPQARSTLSDVQATFFLFLAFHMLVKVRERYRRYLLPRRSDMALFGLGLGGAFLTRLVTAPAILVLLVAAAGVVRFGRRRTGGKGLPLRETIWMATPAAACLALWLFLNHLRFASVFESGYGEAVGAGYFSFPPWLGVVSLFLSPGRGLLYFAPAILLVPFWLVRQLRPGGDPLVGWTVLFVVLAVIAPVAPTEGWHGAHTFGPRYLLPLLPFLWIAVAPTLDLLRESPARRALAYAILASGLATTLPGVLVDYTTHLELATHVARSEWPEPGGETEAERDGARFLHIQYDWRFAAPWAHWRILRHRIAVGDERYPAREIFLVDSDEVLRLDDEHDLDGRPKPYPTRVCGFEHFAWIDFQHRLHGSEWPAALLCLAFLGTGLVLAIGGLNPDRR